MQSLAFGHEPESFAMTKEFAQPQKISNHIWNRFPFFETHERNEHVLYQQETLHQSWWIPQKSTLADTCHTPHPSSSGHSAAMRCTSGGMLVEGLSYKEGSQHPSHSGFIPKSCLVVHPLNLWPNIALYNQRALESLKTQNNSHANPVPVREAFRSSATTNLGIASASQRSGRSNHEGLDHWSLKKHNYIYIYISHQQREREWIYMHIYFTIYIYTWQLKLLRIGHISPSLLLLSTGGTTKRTARCLFGLAPSIQELKLGKGIRINFWLFLSLQDKMFWKDCWIIGVQFKPSWYLRMISLMHV